jgi:flagellar biosynthesis regulator FlaF
MKLQEVESVKAPPLLVRHVNERIAAIRGTYRKELHLKLWPDWPDDRRGAPNAVIRSGVFGVVRRGRRQRVVKMPVAAPGGWEVTLTGWRLDQYDCDIWLEVMHLARNSEPAQEIRFTMYGLLRRLGRTAEGKTNYAWLKQRLENLAETSIAFNNERSFGVMGALIAGFQVDRQTGEGVVYTNPQIRPLWESITHLDIEQRRALGQNQLAKSLHAALASHAEWMPMRVDTLMQRIGAEYERLRDFKRDLKSTLDDFIARNWIRAYQFIPSADSERLEITKIPTPTQVRALDRRKAQ